MLEGFWFHWRRLKLQRSREKCERAYNVELRKSEHEHHDKARIDKIHYDFQAGLYEIDDDISELLTTYYCRKATKNYLPIPAHTEDNMWAESRITGRWHLTSVAIRELRIALRQERKENSELTRMWLAGLTGLVGALAGLAALLFKH